MPNTNHGVIPYLRKPHTSISKCITKRTQNMRFSMVSSNSVFKSEGKRSEQIYYSVQPLPSCATVAANVPFNKTFTTIITKDRFGLGLGFQTKVHRV